MSLFSVVLLSLIQGITEFLPVSSSAHLVLTRLYLGINNDAEFIDVSAHLGSLLAVIWYYRNEVWDIIKNFFTFNFKTPASQLGLKILVATLPIVIVGSIMCYMGWEIKNPRIIIYTSIGAGLCLWLADIIGKNKRSFSDITFFDALFIGLGQVFAIIPGVSRSGSTVTAGLLRNLDRQSTLKFSFMLAIPTVMLAFLSGIFGLVHGGENIMWADAGLVVLFSAIFSFISINIMMKFVYKCSFKWFGIYRVLLGGVLYFILTK